MYIDRQQSPMLSSSDLTLIEGLPSRRVRRLPARADVIRQGDNPRVVNMMVAGWGCRYKQLFDGRRQILSLFLPGDICDANVFMLDVMDHSVGTLTDATIAEISPEDFSRAIGNDGRVAHVLWFNDLRTVAIQREWTTNIGQRTAFERVAHLLCEIFYRLRQSGNVEDDSCDFPMTQTDVGDATGLTPVHVNRMLRQLRDTGLAEVYRRRLRVLNLPALEAEALFDPTYLHFPDEME